MEDIGPQPPRPPPEEEAAEELGEELGAAAVAEEQEPPAGTSKAGSGKAPAVASAGGPAADLRTGTGAVDRAMAGRMDALYSALSLMCTLLAFACLHVTDLTAKALFGSAAHPLEDQHRHLLQLNVGALLAAAGAAAALAVAARHGEASGLGSRLADLLRLALAGQGLANVLLFVYYGRTITALAWPAEMVTNGATLALPAIDLLRRGGMQGLGAELRRAFMPRAGSLLGGAHLLLALLFPLSGVALFYAPKFTLYHFFGYAYGASTFVLAKTAGVADKALIPVMQLALKDAAERGTLSGRGPRMLNAGMLLASLVHMRVLVPILSKGHGGWILPVNLSTWVLTLLTSSASLLTGQLARRPVAGRPAKRGVPEAAGVPRERVTAKEE